MVSALGSSSAAHGFPEQDAKRKVLNDFIRTSGTFDGVIDFDKTTLDPQSGGLKPEFVPDSTTGGPGDKLHPNRTGYLAMGQAIDLNLFAGPREPNCQVEGLILQPNYFICLGRDQLLPSAVVIVSRTCSPLWPAGIAAEMRFPFFGSASRVIEQYRIAACQPLTRNGAAGSILKN